MVVCVDVLLDLLGDGELMDLPVRGKEGGGRVM